jgi:hypothetical protein
MPYRLLLDENVEHVVGHRLDNYGHDVVHVDVVPDLGKGTDDQSIAAFTLSEVRILVTYDDDFVLSVAEDEFLAVRYLPDASPAETGADSIHEVSTQYPQEELDGVAYVGTEWL